MRGALESETVLCIDTEDTHIQILGGHVSPPGLL